MNRYNQKWVSFIFRNPRWAITLGQTAYFSVAEEEVGVSWHRHEDKHKEQWKREGLVRFAVKYLWYQITKGYNKNPYEIEARAAEQGN